jgi:superfamily II DNA or RNA helicase
MQLRPYQQDAVVAGRELVSLPASEPRRLMVVAPTGTGKGVMQRELAASLFADGFDCWILSPSLEVLRGYASHLSIEAKHKVLFEHRLTTPTRFRNRLLDGLVPPPDVIIHDEGHHFIEDNAVSGDILACCPLSAHMAFTATGFRATAKATAKLRSVWGPPKTVLTMTEATANGWMDMPRCSVVPLLNDDVLKVSNGRFVIESMNSECANRAEAIVELIGETRDRRPGGMMVSLPSTDMVHYIANLCKNAMLPIQVILQDTKDAERAEAYEACQNHGDVLLQINVVSEGVDLPWMRTLIDAKPTLSPVMWMQQFGRITRPHEIPAEYICTNRNLERHAYLAEGLVPSAVVAESQMGFGGQSERLGARFIGLEAVGRLKPIPVPLANGLTAAMYNVNASDETQQTEWLIVCLPHIPDPVCFNRVNSAVEWVGEIPTRKWGKWRTANMPSDLVGYASSNARKRMSDKQRAWWKKSALGKGLDATKHEKLTGRQFALLPALYDTRLTLKKLLT